MYISIEWLKFTNNEIVFADSVNIIWADAIKKLFNIDNEVVSYALPEFENRKQEKEEFIFLDKNIYFNHLLIYIIKTKGIDKEIIYDFVKKD